VLGRVRTCQGQQYLSVGNTKQVIFSYWGSAKADSITASVTALGVAEQLLPCEGGQLSFLPGKLLSLQ